MSAQRFDGKQYIPDQASDSTDGADVVVHDLLLETIKALTAERDALVNAVAERDALREQVRVLEEVLNATYNALQHTMDYDLNEHDLRQAQEASALAVAALAQTAETEGR